MLGALERTNPAVFMFENVVGVADRSVVDGVQQTPLVEATGWKVGVIGWFFDFKNVYGNRLAVRINPSVSACVITHPAGYERRSSPKRLHHGMDQAGRAPFPFATAKEQGVRCCRCSFWARSWHL